jgi:hypothetical protein
MKHTITIKDLIYFGAIAEAYKMKGLKLEWSWTFPCGCKGDMTNVVHTYADCIYQENLFWSDRFTELGRTIKMALQQDEIDNITCRLRVSDDESEPLQTISDDATDMLGDVGMSYYQIFMSRLEAEKGNSRLSVLEDHHFYSLCKDWYLDNLMTPVLYEELKINVSCKYLAEKLLTMLKDKEEAVLEATWTPNITESEELLFTEHEVQIAEIDHVTSETADIKAPAS